MGNYISIVIGCVGAIELFAFLHRITLRADREHDEDTGLGPSSAAGGRANLDDTSPQSSSGESPRNSSVELTSDVEQIKKSASTEEYTPPEIRFEEYERSQSITNGVLPVVVDGVKFRPLVRDDGTGRRKAFKKRNSSGSIDSKLSREEELRMFTSLEEEEFSSLSEGYVPISYNTSSDSASGRVKRHSRRYRKSPVNENRRVSCDSSSSREVLKEDEENAHSEVTYPWGDIDPGRHKNHKFWEREKAMSIDELAEEEDKTIELNPVPKSPSIVLDADEQNDKAVTTNNGDESASVSKNRIIVSIESEPAPPERFACEPEEKYGGDETPQSHNSTERPSLLLSHNDDEAEEELNEGPSVEAKVEDWLKTANFDVNPTPTPLPIATAEEQQNVFNFENGDIQDRDAEGVDQEDEEEEDEEMGFYMETDAEIKARPEEIHIFATNDDESEASYLNLNNLDKTELLTNIVAKSSPMQHTENFLSSECVHEEGNRKTSFIGSESGQISECHSAVRNVTPVSVDALSDSYVMVTTTPEAESAEIIQLSHQDDDNEEGVEEEEITDFDDIVNVLNRNLCKSDNYQNTLGLSFPVKATWEVGGFPKEISALLIPDDESDEKVKRLMTRQNSIATKIKKENTAQFEVTGHHPRYNMPLHSIDMSVRLMVSNRHLDKTQKVFPTKRYVHEAGCFPARKSGDTKTNGDSKQNRADEEAKEEHLASYAVEATTTSTSSSKKRRFDGPKLDLTVIDEEGQQTKQSVEEAVVATASTATPSSARRSRSPSPFIADRNDPIMVLLQDSMSIP